MTLSPEVHDSSVIIDFHCDSLLSALTDGRGLVERSDAGHIDLPRLREAGVTAQVFAVWVPPEKQVRGAVEALRSIDAFYQTLEQAEGGLRLATAAADIERCKSDGVLAGVLSLEGADALDGDLACVRMFYRLGVRAIGLTWNHRNLAADGVAESRTGGGLTEFGVELVKELNRLGMLVDISHLSPRGVEDVLQVSGAPIIASHANARSLCHHRRNLTDDQLAAVARTGGVVGLCYYPGFVDDDPQRATLDRLLDHADHMVAVMGIDHVGLGSDFDGFGGEPAPVGLEDVTHLRNLTQKLVDRGYPPDDIRKILGGNFLRVFREVVG